MLTQMVAVAELEAGLISARTKAALAAAKARGVRLGGHHPQSLSAAGRALGRATTARKARDHSKLIKPVLEELQASGVTSLRGMALALNEKGVPSARGLGRWYATGVARLLAR